MTYYTFKSNNLLKLYIPTRALLETILLWSQNKMASTKLIFTFLIAFLLSLFISPSHSFWSFPPNDVGLKVSAIDSPKVNLSLYYDTLCQNCSTFIVTNLTEVFNNDLITVINLRLVPWGNAYINKTNNAIVCQVKFSSPFGFLSFFTSIFVMRARPFYHNVVIFDSMYLVEFTWH